MCAVGGEADESADEALLAWSMLSACCPGAASSAAAVGAELIDPDGLDTSGRGRDVARARARDLVLSRQAHYVSVGHHEHAALYESAADDLDAAVDALTVAARERASIASFTRHAARLRR